MSRRGGGRQPDYRRDQPSPASQQGVGRGRGAGGGRGYGVGRGGRGDGDGRGAGARGAGGGGGGRGRGTVPSSYSPVPAPVVSQPASFASPSTSAPPPPQPRPQPQPQPQPQSQPSSSTVADLARGVERTVTLQDRAAQPSSSKALVPPKRPGYGSIGKKIRVRANHFLVEVADRDLHHYDVSISYTNFVSFYLFIYLYTFCPFMPLFSMLQNYFSSSCFIYFVLLLFFKSSLITIFFSLFLVFDFLVYFKIFFFKCVKLMFVLM